MEYIVLDDSGIIVKHICSNKKPDNGIAVPNGFPGCIGLPFSVLKDDLSGIKSISQQVSEGLLSIPDGYKANESDGAFVRMDQQEIDVVFPPEVWAVPGSFYASTVQKTFDNLGNFGYFPPDGTVKMQEPQPTPYHKAEIDGTWTADVDRAKVAKLSEINTNYNTATSALVATYPQTELLTFDKQEKEARAWDADNSVATPFLDGLALARGIDKAELVRRVIAKSDAFQTAVATLTGLRQRYEDQLSMATTAEEVEAIIPEYSLPEGLNV